MTEDILMDDDFDLLIGEDGDFVTGDSTAQEVELLLLSQKGEWKENPTAGFGLVRWKNKPTGGFQIDNIERFKRELKVELMSDGKGDAEIIINKNDLSDFKIELNAD